ncbi:TFIID-31kDa-domain-containing protein [Hypoxylon fuscum]|nr:TFIID-31kDa-domain-containing protein [Hypoxylon fuscum]
MASSSQTNGVPSSSAANLSQIASQPTQNTAMSGSTTIQNTQATGVSNSTAQAGQQSSAPTMPQAPRPRDSRTIELLLNSQGVTSFEPRVPLFILDFAYRHTSSILSDALHLSTDPYTTHAGARPSGQSGAVPSAPELKDAVITTNAINLAIASRQSFQFRGGATRGAGGGGASKEWLQEVARERNRVALPRVLANEWGSRLPNERFVTGGRRWGLKDQWGIDQSQDEDEDEESEEDLMDVLEGGKKDSNTATSATAEGAQEPGGLDEFLGDDMDEDMEGME